MVPEPSLWGDLRDDGWVDAYRPNDRREGQYEPAAQAHTGDQRRVGALASSGLKADGQYEGESTDDPEPTDPETEVDADEASVDGGEKAQWYEDEDNERRRTDEAGQQGVIGGCRFGIGHAYG